MDVTYYVACSLDGFIADVQGGLGWLQPFEQTGDDYGYGAFFDSVDVVLMGRTTFDFARSQPAWPYAGRPAWVFSRSGLGPLPPDTSVTADTPSVVVDLLRSRGHCNAYLVGGGRLAASFRAEGLITRYIVSVVPAILGGGVPMIAAGNGVDQLELIQSRTFESGIVQSEYRVPCGRRTGALT